MTDTPDAEQPEQVDPQEQYLQEQEAAADDITPVPDTRRRRASSTLPVISEADALDRIAALLEGEGDDLCPRGRQVLDIITDTGRQPAEVAARLAQPSRKDRLLAVAEDHEHALEQLAPYHGTPPRFLLVERDVARSSASFLTLHDTPEAAASYHVTQEDAADWTVEKLVDLDTGAALTPEVQTTVTWS